MGTCWEKIKNKKQFQLSTPKWQIEAYDRHLIRETMRELTQDTIPESEIIWFPSLAYYKHVYLSYSYSVSVPSSIHSLKISY